MLHQFFLPALCPVPYNQLPGRFRVCLYPAVLLSRRLSQFDSSLLSVSCRFTLAVAFCLYFAPAALSGSRFFLCAASSVRRCCSFIFCLSYIFSRSVRSYAILSTKTEL